MSLFEDTIFERLLDALKVGDRVVVTSHLFFEFKTNNERVALAYHLLEEENLLPNLTNSNKKSQKLASDLRNDGNKAFQKKKDFEALKLYNRSLATSPLGSKEFALALGNRSAVNFSMGFHTACIKDIELAFMNGYPDDLRFKLLERQAKCYLQLGLRAESERAIKDLEQELERNVTEKPILSETNLKSLKKDLECLKNESEETLPCFNQLGCSSKPLLSYGKNKEIDCASSCVSLKYSEQKGRHIIATKNINPGDVLIVEQPYASILLPDAAMSHCYYCLSHCESPLPCKHCSEVMFCDEKCRSECWERFHSVDCSLLASVWKSVGKMGFLALRVLILATRKGLDLGKLYKDVEDSDDVKDLRTLGFNKDGHYISTDYWPIHFLIGHTEHRANADLFRRSVTAACLLHCLENLSDFFGPDVDDDMYFFAGGLLLLYLQSLPCNAHEVSEMRVNAGVFESQEIGAAGYATLSLLNHSCDPNVVRHSYQDWAVLRAIRPIKEGEDILDNYGYHHALHSLDYRRSQLSQQYFFHCLCEACQMCWPLYKDQPISNPIFRCQQCGASLKEDRRSMNRVLCDCGAFTNIEELESEITSSSKLFREMLSIVLSGNHKEEVPQILLQHLILLGNTIQRPWREFSECQETIKQCLSLQANHIIINMQR